MRETAVAHKSEALQCPWLTALGVKSLLELRHPENSASSDEAERSQQLADSRRTHAPMLVGNLQIPHEVVLTEARLG